MKNKIIARIITEVILFFVGVGIIIVGIKNKNDYLQPFGIGLLAVSAGMIVKNIRLLTNKKSLIKREIQETDERNNKILVSAYAMSFRICIMLEAIGCLVFALLDLQSFCGLMSAIICIQLIVYVVVYYVLSKKVY